MSSRQIHSITREVFGTICESPCALLIVLPLAIAVLIINLSFGVVAKASPQLNIFSLGFPIIMLFSLFFFWIMLEDFLDIYRLFFREIIDWMKVTWGIQLNG